jgi:cyclopropane-fatty-acyl-phospholipid synthase
VVRVEQVLHFIGNNGTALQGRADPWIDKYIFPGAVLPTLTEFTRLSRNHFFVDDLQCIGPSYAKTLRAWHDNFHAALDDGRLHAAYADPTFVRMWDYYLLVCEALFECRAINLWQFVLVPRPQPLPCGRPAHTAGQADYARVLPACIAATNRVVTIDGSPVNDTEEDEEGK